MNCCICMTKICNICNLDCNHHFCYKCIEKWSILKETCPVCRSPFNMEDVNKNTRLTRSMSKKSRQKNLFSYLNKLISDINNVNDNNIKIKKDKISHLFHFFYTNEWVFKCSQKNIPKNICPCEGCICRKVVTQKIDEFSKLDWEGIKIWNFKFRKYMQNKS